MWTALDGVMSVSSQGVATEKDEAFAVILGLDFTAEDSPAGQVFLRLAGGGTIRICLLYTSPSPRDRG